MITVQIEFLVNVRLALYLENLLLNPKFDSI